MEYTNPSALERFRRLSWPKPDQLIHVICTGLLTQCGAAVRGDGRRPSGGTERSR